MNFKEAWNISNNIPGWLSEIDAKILWHFCSKSQGPILEVGSFLGKSSVLLSCLGDVTCIDPWVAGQKFENCIRSKVPQKLNNFDFLELFEHYTKKTPFANRIKTIRAFDYEVFPYWKTKIGFLFLDHLHSKKSVENSLLGWKPNLMKGAKILVHDANIKEVMEGIRCVEIKIEQLYKESEFMPALCSWPKIHM